MVKKSPASGNKPDATKAPKAAVTTPEKAAPKPRSRKAATSAEAVNVQQTGQGVAWGLSGAPEPAPKELAPDEKTSDGKAPQTPSQVNDQGGGKVTGPGSNLGSIRTDLLPAVEAIERIREEVGALKDDEKEFFASLKTKGYSAKYLRKVLARRAMDPDARIEMDDMIAMYEAALMEAETDGDDE